MSLPQNLPELLAPVGNFETFMAALDAGADAVYLGLKKFSARARAENFTVADLELMTPYAHQRGVKLYVALNTLIRNDELDEIYHTLDALSRLGIDAVIVQDLGLVNILHRDFPELKIHLSTQLALHNAAGVNRLAAAGCSRVVLGRELSLAEIELVARQSTLELELFVYGALCISVAGLCQFSSFFGGQSANRGRCSQPCRRPYTHAGEEGNFFSPADFSALDFLPELIQAGVSSLKIEGRMKGSQYVAVVVGVFRRALDELAKTGRLGAASRKLLTAELKEAYARSTTAANLSGSYPAAIIEPQRAATIGMVVGKVRRVIKEGREGKQWRILLRSSRELEAGDRLKVISQAKDGRDNAFSLKDGFKLEKKRVGKGGGLIVSLPVPFQCQVGDLLVKVGSRDQYGRRGGAWLRKQIAEAVGTQPARQQSGRQRERHYRSRLNDPGSLAAVSVPAAEGMGRDSSWLIKLADWDTAQMFLQRRGWRLALDLNGQLMAAVAGRERDLFRRFPQIEWSLPPLQYPGREAPLVAMVQRLARAGFRRFHLNGLGQFDFFTEVATGLGEAAAVFAFATGPFLHAANQAAVDFYIEQGFSLIHLTPELDAETINSLSAAPGRSLGVTVFSFVPLFLTRVPLPLQRRKQSFFSRRQEELDVIKRDGLSALVSATPFSLLNQLQSLHNPAISLKIVDLTWMPNPAVARRFLDFRRLRLDDLAVSTYNFREGWR
ncbi:MAG: U32 family peptidase [Deltaproteobacteria bacterium]|nr:U32 family peptidase [Deltaproteobacteria bacterium]